MQIPEIDALLNQYIQPDGPGASVAVMKNNEIIHSAGYGLANVEWNIPNAPNTVFRIASITKQFTAIAIMMLAEEGKLSLEDSLTKFLPDYPTAGYTVTIHHLLTHTAGIWDMTNSPDFMRDSRLDFTPDELLATFSAMPFNFAPGERFEYSNSGYILLGIIIEKLSGMSYAEFIQTRIFEPLGMTQSYYLSHEPIVPKRASGYARTGDNTLVNAPFISMTHPYAAGAIGSTVLDLLKWYEGLDTLVSAETLTKMRTKTKLNDGSLSDYAYGWIVDEFAGQPTISHAGGINGFGTYLIEFPDFCIALLANSYDLPFPYVCATIAQHVLGLPVIDTSPLALSSELLAKCCGVFEGDIPRHTLSVRDGNLHVEEFEATLIPLSETRFFNAQNGIFHVFSDEVAGKYQHMEMDMSFSKFNLTRIEDV